MSTWFFDLRDQKHACFKCRKSFNGRPAKCPNCGGNINVMGTVFKAPKRNDIKQWRAIEMLYKGGIRYEHENLVESVTIYEWSYEVEHCSREWLIRTMRGYSAENPVWELPLFQLPWPRPTDPRQVPAYLDAWWNKIQLHVNSIVKLCQAFDLPTPIIVENEAVKGMLKIPVE